MFVHVLGIVGCYINAVYVVLSMFVHALSIVVCYINVVNNAVDVVLPVYLFMLIVR